MKILKCATFLKAEALVQFVNDNNLPREDIVTITRSAGFTESVDIAIFYYADAEIKEKTRGWFGKLSD